MEKQIQPEQRKNCLFVSKIPPTAEKQDVFLYFSQFGPIKLLELKSKLSGNTPQIATIEAESLEIYQKILKTTKHEFGEGIYLKVEELLEGDALEDKLQEVYKRRVSIFGVYGKVKNDSLKEAFSQFGEVEVCYLSYYKDNPSKAHGFITFKNEESAKKALAHKKIRLNKKNVKIKEFKVRQDRLKKSKSADSPPDEGTPEDQKNKKKFKSVEERRKISSSISSDNPPRQGIRQGDTTQTDLFLLRAQAEPSLISSSPISEPHPDEQRVRSHPEYEPEQDISHSHHNQRQNEYHYEDNSYERRPRPFGNYGNQNIANLNSFNEILTNLELERTQSRSHPHVQQWSEGAFFLDKTPNLFKKGRSPQASILEVKPLQNKKGLVNEYYNHLQDRRIYSLIRRLVVRDLHTRQLYDHGSTLEGIRRVAPSVNMNHSGMNIKLSKRHSQSRNQA